MPIVTLTVMPGFRSTIVALCPFRLISVNCVMINVRVVFSSLTVMALPITLEMTGVWYAGVAFFFLLPPKAGVAVITASVVQTATNEGKRDFFIDSV